MLEYKLDLLKEVSILTGGTLQKELLELRESTDLRHDSLAVFLEASKMIESVNNVKLIPEFINCNTVFLTEAAKKVAEKKERSASDDLFLDKFMEIPKKASDVVDKYSKDLSFTTITSILDTIDCAIEELEYKITSLTAATDKLTQYVGKLKSARGKVDKVVQERLEIIEEHLGQLAPVVTGEDQVLRKPMENAFVKDYFSKTNQKRETQVSYIKAFFGDKVTLEGVNDFLYQLDEFMEIEEPEEVVLEGPVAKIQRKAAIGADKVSRKVTNSFRKAKRGGTRVSNITKRSAQRVDSAVDKVISDLKKVDRDERRKRIIEGGYKQRLLKIIRTGVTGGIGFAIHPVIGAIYLLSVVARDKKLDQKQRRQIVSELELELKMVNEKIDDAKSANDKQAKYRLMRMQSKLEKEITRIKYDVKDMERE